MSSETASKSYKHRGRPGKVKNPGPPNRKAHAKLEARLKDYFATTSDSKKTWTGYHKPGSMQGPR